MRNTAIWFNNFIKFLKNKFYFDNQVSIEVGSLNPTSAEVNAKEGSLYISTSENSVFVKQDEGSSLNWNPVGGGVGGAGLLNVVVMETSGTYTKNSEASFFVVEAVGGGGGGGGCVASGSGLASAAGCAGGGEYVLEFYNNIEMDEEVEVIIGAGGTGGEAGNNAGTDGGITYFNNTLWDLQANGGIGGGGGFANTAGGLTGVGGDGGANGLGDGGILRIAGSDGCNGNVSVSGLSTVESIAGNSFLSSSKRVSGNAETGLNGVGYGAGGAGGRNVALTAATAGGNGAAGVVIIWEYK